MAQTEYTSEQIESIPTDKDVQDYETMMQALINISGHLHMLEGHYDMLIIVKRYVSLYDPTLLPRLGSLIDNAKRANKQIAKTFVKDSERSKILMFEQIGKGISSMSEMSYEKSQQFLNELEILSEKYK